jgi:hypothetical protein
LRVEQRGGGWARSRGVREGFFGVKRVPSILGGTPYFTRGRH